MSAKILFFAGSARKDSVNKKLAKHAYDIAIEKGADASFADLKDYPMPIYDGDFEDEHGVPEQSLAFKKLFTEHDAIFIAAPEYNSSLAPLLKNTLDWISRTHEEDEPMLSAYNGKVAAIAAASPGGLGGLRGLVPLRMMLENINVLVLPNQLAVGGAFKAFDDNGKLTDNGQVKTLTRIVERLIATTNKLA